MQMNVDRPGHYMAQILFLAFTSGSDVATKDPIRKPYHLTEFILCMAVQGSPQLKPATKSLVLILNTSTGLIIGVKILSLEQTIGNKQ